MLLNTVLNFKFYYFVFLYFTLFFSKTFLIGFSKETKYCSLTKNENFGNKAKECLKIFCLKKDRLFSFFK